MSRDNIDTEAALAYLLEDIATALQLIAGDLRRQPFVSVEARFLNVCDAVSRAKLAARSIGVSNPDYTLSLIDQIRQYTGLIDSTANAANELRQAQQRAEPS